ncbi:MAG: hypothetical protein ACI9LO_000568 [Planctomycetota bacterium]|jgi:hypothetical protein
MNPINSVSSSPENYSAQQSAEAGIRQQIQRLDENVTTVAQSSFENSADADPQRSLVEQQEIVQAVRANASSLVASNEVVGTLLDIKV